MSRTFQQVDVFGAEAWRGNALAAVLDAPINSAAPDDVMQGVEGPTRRV